MYLSDATVPTALGRLRRIDPRGKTGTERTSALMYFLAYDKLVRKGNYSTSKKVVIDFDPSTVKGRLNRQMFTANYCALVTVSDMPSRQIATLGDVSNDPKSPEKRVSGNFLTVPLKKGTTASGPVHYPSRPAPLLTLGSAGTGRPWGVMRHPDWKANLAQFLSDTGSKTPFTDLAIVVLRDSDLGEDSSSSSLARIKAAIALRFTTEISADWGKRISSESLKTSSFPKIDFQPTRSKSLETFGSSSRTDGKSPTPAKLQKRIRYLEKVLRMHRVPFDSENA
jgi:hypothetical protein